MNTVLGLSLILVLLQGLAGPLRAAAAEIAIVANKSYPASEITLPELKKIYLGEKEYEAGIKINPLDQKESNPIRRQFAEQLLGSSVPVYNGYWLKRVFREGTIPPRVRENAREVLESIGDDPGAIGYVPAEETKGRKDLKVLLVVPIRE